MAEGNPLLQQPPIKTIYTSRLQLKTVTMDDLEDIKSFITLKEVMQWTSTAPVTTHTQAHQWLSARTFGPQVFNFAVRERCSTTSQEIEPKVIGIYGFFHPPSCGYMLHPAHAGKGYATEGMRAWIPAFFERFEGEYDVLEAWVDAENLGSMRVLEKCGFTKCEFLERDFEGPMGVRDSVVWRLARPGGKTLREMGFLGEGQREEEEEGPPVPPVQ